ncbi:MAG: hypothetical protein MZU95_12645 [Desulfomicrobium escambiense]|nr:hypothetical protein [Desulfomicrobium escambiense]
MHTKMGAQSASVVKDQSNLPDFCEFLVRVGIDSISVNNDAVASTRRNVAGIEQKIVLERLAEAAAIAARQTVKETRSRLGMVTFPSLT